ncbi:MAG: RHS repeat-associated core domain-containing protein [Granulosicoccaceae bacterium]
MNAYKNVTIKLTAVFLLTVLAIAPLQAATYFYHTDHLGTPQAVTDENQQVVWQGEQDPFGENSPSVNLIEQNLRFPGQYFDAETGLHYNYFRDYDPSIGRYVESDPIGLDGGVNTYMYASARPIQNVDRLGLFDFGPTRGGGRCCNRTDSVEWVLVGGNKFSNGSGVWVPLPPGSCTAPNEDCDGMSCSGGFYYAENMFWGIRGESEKLQCGAEIDES